jgi:hypothetical protein
VAISRRAFLTGAPPFSRPASLRLNDASGHATECITIHAAVRRRRAPHRARGRSGGSSERQPGRSSTASTGLSPDDGLQSSHTAHGLRSASGSADGTTSRWVTEKPGENARRAADMDGLWVPGSHWLSRADLDVRLAAGSPVGAGGGSSGQAGALGCGASGRGAPARRSASSAARLCRTASAPYRWGARWP